MPTRSPPPDETSQGGWSDPGAETGNGSAEPSGAPTAAPPGDRYTIGALLGRGGMGVVHAARDTALGRDVALKELQPERADDARAAARLAREAAITSRLDHPGIVAVHDAGHLPDGRPFYTMRLVRGQTLARVASEAASPEAQRQLVRHVLAAADAVAAAHDAGIVHRDLKPSNILIGAHGETQVVDWGLATPTLAAAARWADLPAIGAHGPVGTEAYMAPEQARGDPPDPRHDVWSLGATLDAVFGGGDAAPPEIAAIVARARAPEAARYPDAAAFAEDLLRWFEGRRVAAFSYSPGDLLRRTLAAYRLPLIVGATGFAVVGLAVAVGWWQTTRSLARALDAESAAADALADLQLERAVDATRAGTRERAERLALAVLKRREDPLARGVFAAFGRAERPVRLSTSPGPDCLWSAVPSEGDDVICGHEAAIGRWSGGAARWSAAVGAVGGRLHGKALVTWDAIGTTTVLDAATGALLSTTPMGGWDWLPETVPRRVWTAEGEFPTASTPACPCQGNLRVVEPGSGGRLAAVCGDGRLFVGSVAEPTHLTVATDFVGDHVATALAWLPGNRVAVGSLRGRVAVYAGDSGLRLAAGATALGSIREIAASANGDVLAVEGTAGGVGLWRVGTAALVGEIPAARPRSFAFSAEGLRVHDGDVTTWRVPVGAPALVRTSGGLADVTVSAAGDRIAMGVGDGAVLSVGLADGQVHEHRLGERVVKAVIFEVVGAGLLASGMAAPFLTRAEPGEAAIAVAGGRPLRRLASLPDGSLLGVDVDYGLYRWASITDSPTILAPDRVFSDVERDGATLVVLDGHGAVERLDGTTFTLLATVPDARAVALRGHRLAIARPDGVELHIGDEVRQLPTPGASLLDVALSADGQRVAAVGLDTTVRVWDCDTGKLLGSLPGHSERVVAVEFLPDGDLVSASWDKTARIWSVSALSTPVETLARDISAAWGYAPR